MQDTPTAVSQEVLYDQLMEWLAAGGTLGDTLGYDETDYEALYAMGHGLYEQARYPEAAKVFGYLVLNNHFERRYANAFASALHMAHRYEDAMKFYATAYAMDSSDPAPTLHASECLIALGRKAEAQEGLSMVIGQCRRPEQAGLKQRAQAIMSLLTTVLTTAKGN